MMKRYAVHVGLAVLMMFSAGLAGGGLAAAKGPNFSGQTYGSAAEQTSNLGLTPVIASSVGDQLAINDCIVISSTQVQNINSSGRANGSRVLMQLDCNAPLAGPGKAGASAVSPEGRKVKKELSALGWFNRNPAKNCAGANIPYCKKLCTKYSSECSVAVQDIVASV